MVDKGDFDRRVLPQSAIELVRRCQQEARCDLGGGVVLSGLYLRHRLSDDLDLFFDDMSELRKLFSALPMIARDVGYSIEIVQDAAHFVRAKLGLPNGPRQLDLVHEHIPGSSVASIDIEGVQVMGLADIRARKLTCLLSRSEPRDLVDEFFLERAGWPIEGDLESAARIDSGLDPGVLSWLLAEFPVEPLPRMIIPITVEELRAYRDEVKLRLRAIAVPDASELE